MSPLKLAQKTRIQKDSLLMFHVKTTASLTTKPIYFPLESWEGGHNQQRNRRLSMPPEKTASRTAVGGRFWGPFVTFHWATFQKPRDVCRDVCVLCFRDMFFLRFFFVGATIVLPQTCFFCFASWWCFMFYIICTSLKRQICRCIHVLDVCFCFSLFWTGMVVFISRDGWFKNLSILKSPLATAKKTPTTRLMFNLYSQPIIIYLQRTTFSRALSWVFIRWTSPGSTQYRWSVFKVIPGHLWP